tara:strand:+ start:140 stop:1240 length:1101 start_codon:yes stop_codon:yes gene_type:complete
MIRIQTTHLIADIGVIMRDKLLSMGINAWTGTSDKCEEFIRKSNNKTNNDIYIFLYVGQMHILPTNSPFYVFNLEQVLYHPKTFPWCSAHGQSRENDMVYIAMNSCKQILDYSMHNIEHYPAELKNKVTHLPLPISIPEHIPPRGNNIVFYGTFTPRRRQLIEIFLHNKSYFTNKYSTQFVYGNLMINEELEHALHNARIVLNIHAYKDSVLETARLNNILKESSATIISEESVDTDTMKIYNPVVTFIPSINDDFSNINILIEAIDKVFTSPESKYSKDKLVHIEKQLNQINHLGSIFKEATKASKEAAKASEEAAKASEEAANQAALELLKEEGITDINELNKYTTQAQAQAPKNKAKKKKTNK